MPDLDVLVVEVVVSLSSLVIGVTKVVSDLVSDSFDRVATEPEMDMSSAEPSEAGGYWLKTREVVAYAS